MTAAASHRVRVRPGRRFPLGATPGPGGTNFAVSSGVADAMLLCLFDDAGAETRIALPDYDAGVWHGFVEVWAPYALARRRRSTRANRPATRPSTSSNCFCQRAGSTSRLWPAATV